jgi:hypothetical protein
MGLKEHLAAAALDLTGQKPQLKDTEGSTAKRIFSNIVKLKVGEALSFLAKYDRKFTEGTRRGNNGG